MISHRQLLNKARSSSAFMRKLLADDSGLAMTEFAFVAPFFLSIGLLGADTASYVIAHMRISQVAMQVADNASRVGEQETLVSRRVFEDDIVDLFLGAERYAGGLDLSANSRIILSSLETNDSDGQWIHWQRCYGELEHESSFGEADDGRYGTDFDGMGEDGKEITASVGNAVMFVEVAYTYQPISPFTYLEGERVSYTASFNVRDQRDLTGLYQTNPVSAVASCD